MCYHEIRWDTTKPIISSGGIEVISMADKVVIMSDEQKAVILQILARDNRVELIPGKNGTFRIIEEKRKEHKC